MRSFDFSSREKHRFDRPHTEIVVILLRELTAGEIVEVNDLRG